MDTSRLNKQIEQIDKAFHSLWRGIMLGGDKSVSETLKGLGFIDMQLIEIARKKPDAILKEIRDYLRIPQTTLSSAIARLEKKCLLKRTINHKDMRSFSLEITEKGKEILEEHKSNDYEQSKSILLLLDEDERIEFIRLMTKISSRMEKNLIDTK